MNTHAKTCRQVMWTARPLRLDEIPRPLDECLRTAWRLSKSMLRHPEQIHCQAEKDIRHIRFGGFWAQSATQRPTADGPFGRYADDQAASTTKKVGW